MLRNADLACAGLEESMYKRAMQYGISFAECGIAKNLKFQQRFSPAPQMLRVES